MNKPWFPSNYFTSLDITKFKSISTREVKKVKNISDVKTIRSLVERIEQIPSHGDMMISFGPDAEYLTLTFKDESQNQVIEIIQQKFKTPSTGFNSRNALETDLYNEIVHLLS